MSVVDVGQQRIGWKFSTPLQADYLNTFLAGFSNPGLLTRPKIDVVLSNLGADITIHGFSILIVPTDKKAVIVDENGKTPIQRLVKITTTADVLLSITKETVAIGLTYSFTNNMITQSQWYADIVVLDASKIETFDGIIIATSQSFTNPTTGKTSFSVTTSGADISDALLLEEGWNPHKWLSLIHPKRAKWTYTKDGVTITNYMFNRLEIRNHNDSYKGYMNGIAGLVEHNSCVYNMDTNIDPSTNPEGIRGFMPGNINGFKLQTLGFGIAETGSELPLTKTSGGIFAMVDATNVNNIGDYNSFANKLKIYPVFEEDLNCYFDNDTKTLNIR